MAQVDYQSSDSSSQVYYTLQDANYNVVALADSTGNVKQQYTYDPYGTLAATEYFDQQPIENNIGHQGLFQIRMDGQTGLSTNTPAIYYNRNRYYSPILGRFIQRDPNATALTVITPMAMNGEALSILSGGFNPAGHFSDGMNLYEYLCSRPTIGTDPSGQFLGALLDFMAGSSTTSKLRAASVGASVTALGYFRTIVEALNFRNQMWTAIYNNAAALGQRGGDILPGLP